MKTQETLKKEESLQKRIESYWDIRSPAFADVRRKELKSKDRVLWQKLLKRHLPKGDRLRILDVGTGAGFFAVLFSRMGHDVTAIDMSAGMILEAKRNLEIFGAQAWLKKMNAQQLEFPSVAFDVLISRNLTWTLPDALQAYKEWHRVLKVGGMLLNFDADWGKETFVQAEDKDDVHAGIKKAQINECNAIKNELRISTHRRPLWDKNILTALGFFVQLDENIAPLVHSGESIHYDDVALFGIYAKKIK